MLFKTISVNVLIMTCGLLLGALIGPRLFPVPHAQAAGRETQDLIVARRIELVDDAGSSRMILQVRDDGAPGISMVAPGGKESIALAATDKAAFLAVSQKLSLSHFANSTSLDMWDDKGNSLIDLGLDETGAHVAVSSATMKSHAAIVAPSSKDDDLDAYFVSFGSKGEILWSEP